MYVKFWGTRGSVPTPGAGTAHYGGNTSCVEVRTEDGTLIILDCGTGVRVLGQSLMEGPQPVTGHILISHTHWDHTQGFAFFAPTRMEGNRFTIYGAAGFNLELQDTMAGQMDYLYFPVSLSELGADIEFKEFGEETFAINDHVEVRTQYINHTVLTLGFRITADDTTVVYCCDHEPYYPDLYRAETKNPAVQDLVHKGDRAHVRFIEGADLLIHDAQYTADEYATKHNWGHSPVNYVVEIAALGGVKRLALTHHDPEHDDDTIAGIEAKAREFAASRYPSLEVVAAYEGLVFDLAAREEGSGEEGSRPDTAADETAAADRLERATERAKKPKRTARAEEKEPVHCILVAEDDPLMMRLINVTLRDAGCKVLEANDGIEALSLAAEHGGKIDIIMLDLDMPRMNGFEALKRLRQDSQWDKTPVVMLTAHEEQETHLRGFELGITDYMTKPIAPTMLRTRVERLLLGVKGPGRKKPDE